MSGQLVHEYGHILGLSNKYRALSWWQMVTGERSVEKGFGRDIMGNIAATPHARNTAAIYEIHRDKIELRR